MFRRRPLARAALLTVPAAVVALANLPSGLAQAAPPAANEVTLTPPQGPVGTDLTVSGRCALIDGEKAALATAVLGESSSSPADVDADHHFTISLKVPVVVVGSHTIYVICQSALFAESGPTAATFVVTAGPTTPTTPPGGATTTTAPPGATATTRAPGGSTTTTRPSGGSTTTTAGGSTTTTLAAGVPTATTVVAAGGPTATVSPAGSASGSGLSAAPAAKPVTADADYVG